MVVSSLRGAVGFLTTLPVGAVDSDWDAFRKRVETIPLVGYLIGAIVAVPVFVAPTAALGGIGFVLAIYLTAGINHFDGLTDFADALAVHGDVPDRVEALRDSQVGVGGLLVGIIVVLGAFVVGFELRGLGWTALGLIVAAEVGAKLGMLVVLVLGEPRHDGLGSALMEFASTRSLAIGGVIGVPAVFLTWPHPIAALAIGTAVLVSVAIERIADSRLGGVNGDVLGTTNEIARLLALLVGVIAWTLS